MSLKLVFREDLHGIYTAVGARCMFISPRELQANMENPTVPKSYFSIVPRFAAGAGVLVSRPYLSTPPVPQAQTYQLLRCRELRKARRVTLEDQPLIPGEVRAV